MTMKYPLNRSIRKEYSIYHYAIRSEKDLCLHNDVGDFMTKHGDNIPRLLDKLLNNDFVLARYTDPAYPE